MVAQCAGKNGTVYKHILCGGLCESSLLCGRYQVNCNQGQILSYSIHKLSLEPESTCNGKQECVDWVRIESDTSDEFREECGTQDFTNRFFFNGQAAHIEFVTNRNMEEAGFLIIATCSEPNNTQARPDDEKMKRAASEKCTFPAETGWARVANISPRQEIVSTSFPVDHSLVVPTRQMPSLFWFPIVGSGSEDNVEKKLQSTQGCGYD